MDAFVRAFDARIGLERLVDGPSQRFEGGARLAHGPPRASRGGADRRARPGAPSSPTRASRGPPTTSRRRGWTRATTPSTSRVRTTSRPGGPSRPCPGGDGAPRQPGQVRPGRARADGRAVTVVPSARPPRVSARSIDLAVLLGLIALAAVMRLPDLATRGTWDADQGHDMLVLRAFVRDGVVPAARAADVDRRLPPRGVCYYLLLAPAAALTGGDSPTGRRGRDRARSGSPRWASRGGWRARSAGPSRASSRALVMAVSASAIEESTFIWNPNLIALTSAVALAAAWRAWTTRRAGWWLLSRVRPLATMQCHVLGVALLLPIVGVAGGDLAGDPGRPRASPADVVGPWRPRDRRRWLHAAAGVRARPRLRREPGRARVHRVRRDRRDDRAADPAPVRRVCGSSPGR